MANKLTVKRERIAACMTCPLCNKLLRSATAISECLHTFCRKCIYRKISDEEVDYCPICNIDLGCVPLEKLRPDHNLQDARAKIFPLKRRKVVETVVLPVVRRKERSLSSLVSTQTTTTGRRTKHEKLNDADFIKVHRVRQARALSSAQQVNERLERANQRLDEKEAQLERLGSELAQARKEAREEAQRHKDELWVLENRIKVLSEEGKSSKREASLLRGEMEKKKLMHREEINDLLVQEAWRALRYKNKVVMSVREKFPEADLQFWVDLEDNDEEAPLILDDSFPKPTPP